MGMTRDDLLKAGDLKRLGHVAYHLRLTAALSRPMAAILGADAPRGRVQRELKAIADRSGGQDLASLLAYGDDLLMAKNQKPLKAKLLTLARSFLVHALEEGESESSSQARRPADRAALRRWANEHRVGPLLDASVYRELNPTQPDLFSGMVDQAVENGPFETLLGDPDLPKRTRIARTRLARLQDAAWSYLQDRAHEAATAAAEAERAGLTTEPDADDDSVRARLIRRALEARSKLLPAVVPRAMSQVRSEPYRIEDGSPPTFVHTEAPLDRYAFPTKVRVPLELDRSWTLACSDHKAPCSHRLTAIDRLLDRLKNGDPEAVASIVDPVGLPDWSRGLKAIDAALKGDADTPDRLSVPEITWGVTTVGRRPEIAPWLRSPTKTGALGKARRLKPDKLLDGDYELDPDDRHIAELLELHQLMPDPTSTRSTRVLQRALQRLIGHPRVVRQPEGQPLTVRRGSVALVTERSDGHVRLLPSIDGQVLPLDGLRGHRQARIGRLLLHVDGDVLVLAEVSPTLEAVVQALAQHEFRLPEGSLDELVKRLPDFSPCVPIVFDREVPRTSVPAQRHLFLRLSPRGRGLAVTVGVMPLADGPVHPPGEGPAEVLVVGPDHQLQSALRDRAAEAEWARERVRSLLPNAEQDDSAWRYSIANPQDALTSLGLMQAADDATVAWTQGQGWKIMDASAEPKHLHLGVQDRRDWFGLHGDLDYEGRRIPIDALVDAVRRQDEYLPIADGQWIKISAALRARIEAIEPHVQNDEGQLAVGPAAADALEALGDDSAEFVRSVRWSANLERLQAARDVSTDPPAGLKAELRDYQRDGFRWMLRLATWGLGACLADDMGLGKTVQTLAVLIARAKQGPQLVVAPTSVVYNWEREASRFAPELRPRLYIGPDRADLLNDPTSGTVLITSYGLLVRDIELLKPIRFASLVLDEAQAVKNAHAQRSVAVRAVNADWRLALSGTPVENHLGELWALFTAVAPGLLGGWTDFRDRFLVPIERDGNRARADALARLIRPFILRRTKSEVSKELPARTSVNLDVVLTEAEEAAYEQARSEAVAALAGGQPQNQARFQALAALTRLRQLACNPRLVDPASTLPSSKLARFMELVRNLVDTGQRALVFSQFTSHLALVKEALDEAGFRYLYLDGQTPAETRAQRVAAFQGGTSSLFLISLKAGGTGLTLTGADTVIHLDPWWNPAVEDQATDRAHRIGQTKPVTVYRLVAKGTIEEGILQMHDDKRALVAKVLDGTEVAATLSTDELIGLIQGRGRA